MVIVSVAIVTWLAALSRSAPAVAVTSHTLTSVTAVSPVINRLPSGEKATLISPALVPAAASEPSSCSPSSPTPRIRAVPSSLAVASSAESGLQLTPWTVVP